MARAALRIDVSDEELMHRVQTREDVAAFGSLYDRHATHAYGVARSVCGDRSRAEEAVQEGFLSIWRRRARFRPEGSSFRAWSMTVIRNAAVDRARYDAAGTRPRTTGKPVDVVDRVAEPLVDRVIRHSDEEALHSHLARLPDAQAEVISLAFFGGLTHSEIAQELALSPGTVKGRMRLGLEKLRRRMDREASDAIAPRSAGGRKNESGHGFDPATPA